MENQRLLEHIVIGNIQIDKNKIQIPFNINITPIDAKHFAEKLAKEFGYDLISYYPIQNSKNQEFTLKKHNKPHFAINYLEKTIQIHRYLGEHIPNLIEIAKYISEISSKN